MNTKPLGHGSYTISEEANLLFKYSNYLKIYERPNAKKFIKSIPVQNLLRLLSLLLL
jgi:hypothetical protein